MNKALYLDDIREPHWTYQEAMLHSFEWTTVESFEQFTAWITENGLPNFISFDHDLGGVDSDGNEVDPSTVKTGLDCAKWLVNYCMDHDENIPAFSVHSANVVGNRNIRRLLKAWSEELNQ